MMDDCPGPPSWVVTSLRPSKYNNCWTILFSAATNFYKYNLILNLSTGSFCNDGNASKQRTCIFHERHNLASTAGATADCFTYFWFLLVPSDRLIPSAGWSVCVMPFSGVLVQPSWSNQSFSEYRYVKSPAMLALSCISETRDISMQNTKDQSRRWECVAIAT